MHNCCSCCFWKPGDDSRAAQPAKLPEQGHRCQDQRSRKPEENVNIANQLNSSYQTLEAGTVVNSRVVLNALPNKYDFPAIATSIEKIASDGGYKLVRFSGEDSVDAVTDSKNPEPVEVPFTVEIEGSYDTVKKFANDLQRSIRPFVVTGLDITGSQKNVRAVFSVSTYYQPAKNLTFEEKDIR